LRSRATREGFSIDTSSGTLRARDLIVATNGYTGPAAGALRRRVVPVTSYMIATDALPAALMSKLMPRGRVITDTNRLLVYYRPSPDRKRILFGGRPGVIPNSRPEQSAKRLASWLHALFPAVAEVPITHSWFGMIAYTFDRLPHVGKVDGFHYAGGYCGLRRRDGDVARQQGSHTRVLGHRRRRERVRRDRTPDAIPSTAVGRGSCRSCRRGIRRPICGSGARNAIQLGEPG
jgi:hypothetical protein